MISLISLQDWAPSRNSHSFQCLIALALVGESKWLESVCKESSPVTVLGLAFYRMNWTTRVLAPTVLGASGHADQIKKIRCVCESVGEGGNLWVLVVSSRVWHQESSSSSSSSSSCVSDGSKVCASASFGMLWVPKWLHYSTLCLDRHHLHDIAWKIAWQESLLWNARLFIILFVRNFWRVCSQFWLSVRNSVWGPLNRNWRENPSLCWLGGGGVKGNKNSEQKFCEQTGVS